MPRRNRSPVEPQARHTGATRMFVEFHGHEPDARGRFAVSLKIPPRAVCVGDAVNVLYASDKLNPTTLEDEGWIDYIHEHKRGVKIYRCDAGAIGESVAVPAWLRGCSELTWLGDCLGLAYKSPELGHVDGVAWAPMPELYTIPSGKALLVIQGKRELLALVWGGNLGVEPRGIVN